MTARYAYTGTTPRHDCWPTADGQRCREDSPKQSLSLVRWPRANEQHRHVREVLCETTRCLRHALAVSSDWARTCIAAPQPEARRGTGGSPEQEDRHVLCRRSRFVAPNMPAAGVDVSLAL